MRCGSLAKTRRSASSTCKEGIQFKSAIRVNSGLLGGFCHCFQMTAFYSLNLRTRLKDTDAVAARYSAFGLRYITGTKRNSTDCNTINQPLVNRPNLRPTSTLATFEMDEQQHLICRGLNYCPYPTLPIALLHLSSLLFRR
ncbi:hypothetical protein Ciccas_013898 [Cichlidogyrus casuarinus]|uniref:Uncharacterized protein n=1 Tax=Cichlidogyrus casuarinus TaxID=1844966 RepID=A0ABD2PKF2_9PLAT